MLRLIVSPAKTVVPEEGPLPLGAPAFLAEAEELTARLRSMDRGALQRLWGTSDALTGKALAALDAWSPAGGGAAVLSFCGIQYTAMAPSVMTDGQLSYLGEHLRILSGLYGVLRPFDAVAPYRLEMGARLGAGTAGWDGSGCRDLYGFWGPRLAEEVLPEGEGLLVNVASKEYARAVVPRLAPGVRCVTCLFGCERDGRWVQRATEAKRARGTFVAWCAERGVGAEGGLAAFDRGGYALDRARSAEDGTTLVFTRR